MKIEKGKYFSNSKYENFPYWKYEKLNLQIYLEFYVSLRKNKFLAASQINDERSDQEKENFWEQC